ncbi:vWA domain-containing protein [Cohnella faecalis]|uniref:VWA domain-containing protein n=1 Tax=Cohnella faecalis TaxID=2315694 RepID=A0A398CH94_9BACL|nr:vWA domain-containing protein [Cohnella faecalis]RIE01342.1 VWA domain-containing protein [Cohnella faecalis]
MRQILLITDGGSNVGESPVVAAARALTEGVTVNVVGVVDESAIGEHGAAEIAEIAKAGGGMSRVVSTRQLSQTVQMMTRQTVAGTIRTAVNQELRQLFGLDSVGALPPPKRAEVVKVMEEMEETSPLRIVLLIDASASMKPKLHSVEDAIRDLVLSLQARVGNSAVAVFHFPGDYSHLPCVMDCDWTTDSRRISSLFARIQMKGTTPTGPALMQVVDFIRDTCGNIKTELMEAPPQLRRGDPDGVRSDYVV